MQYIHLYIHFLDVGSIAIFIVMAYLSKRLGVALKIAPIFYKLLYLSTILVISAIILDTIQMSRIFPLSSSLSITLTMVMRGCAGVLAIFSSLRYWKWLFVDLERR